MAGMFYSLKEAAQRLGVAEDQVKQLAKDGKLREFRDGSNLLFKIEEVNALLAEGLDLTSDELELQEVSAEEPAADLGDTAAAALGESVDEDIFKLDEEGTGALEATGEAAELSDSDLIPELQDLEAAGTESEEPKEDEAAEVELEAPQPTEQAAEEDLLLAEELGQPAGEEPEPLVADEAEGSSEEISLAAESGVLAEGSDISDADTAITTEGVNVLSETDTDYEVTEDSMAETAGPAATAEKSGEASLEEIEDDVNLDSFGSGSGLLDLSLQADDTSLGGILDEIYTAEGGEGEATPAEGEPAEVGAEAGEAASFEEITAEADHAAPAEEEMAVPEPAGVMPTAMVPAYAEAAPDAQSNILGMLLFLPMLALLYTAIVTVAAMHKPEPVMPSILSAVKGLIWYIMGAGVVLALVTVGISFTAGRERAPKAAKMVKDKKAKEKPRKEAPKAEAAKPAKEKKGFSLFGKKKEKK